MVTGLRVDVITTVEGFESLEAEWNAFHEEAGGTVFQSYTWLHAWWDIYGHRADNVHIITARMNGLLTAILPMYRQASGIPPVELVRLRLLGVYETYGEYEVLVGKEHAHESIHAIARHLSSLVLGGEVDMVSFFRFSRDSGPMGLLIDAMRIREMRSRLVTHVITRVMMDLPPTWDAYLSHLSPNERQSLRRKLRHFESDGVTLERITSPDAPAFADYVRLHMSSWEERHIRGYFSSTFFRTFLERVNDTLMRAGRARLYFLVKDGVRFAAVHAFFVNGTCCFYLSGLDRRHPLVARSPGKILLAMVIREAIAEGCVIFDFQGGDETYKFQLGGVGTTFAKALFWSGGLRSWKVMSFLSAQYVTLDFGRRIQTMIMPIVRRVLGRSTHGASRGTPPGAHHPSRTTTPGADGGHPVPRSGRSGGTVAS